MKRFKLFLAAPLILTLAACTNWERTTFQTLSASQATINQAQDDYEAGVSIPKTRIAYDAINTAKLAQTNAVEAMITYENLKATGASKDSLTKAQVAVTTALAVIPADIVALKALYSNKGASK